MLGVISMNQQDNNQFGENKKGNGFFKVLSVLIILGLLAFVGVKFAQYQFEDDSVQQAGTTKPSNQGNSNSSNKLFTRKANTNDVIVDYDMDLSNFGMKCVVYPQTDINNLELTIEFLDSNKKVLTTKVKTLGNVKKGVQASFSISIGELGLSVAWKTEYSRISVSGGSVSYFA